MKIRIMGVTLLYDSEDNLENARINFSMHDDELNFSGQLTINEEEYAGNEAVEQLEGIVLGRLNEKLGG